MCFTPDDGKGNLRPPLLAYGGIDRVINLRSAGQSGSRATSRTSWSRKKRHGICMGTRE